MFSTTGFPHPVKVANQMAGHVFFEIFYSKVVSMLGGHFVNVSNGNLP